jgi:hypothetical protein
MYSNEPVIGVADKFVSKAHSVQGSVGDDPV